MNPKSPMSYFRIFLEVVKMKLLGIFQSMQLNIFCLLISHLYPRLPSQLKYSASIFKRNSCFWKFQYPVHLLWVEKVKNMISETTQKVMQKEKRMTRLVDLLVVFVLWALFVLLRIWPSEEFTVLSWRKYLYYRAVCFQLPKQSLRLYFFLSGFNGLSEV